MNILRYKSLLFKTNIILDMNAILYDLIAMLTWNIIWNNDDFWKPEVTHSWIPKEFQQDLTRIRILIQNKL